MLVLHCNSVVTSDAPFNVKLWLSSQVACLQKRGAVSAQAVSQMQQCSRSWADGLTLVNVTAHKLVLRNYIYQVFLYLQRTGQQCNITFMHDSWFCLSGSFSKAFQWLGMWERDLDFYSTV